MLNATDVHLLVACLPAWCSYPWTADARVDSTSLFRPLAYACARVHACWLRVGAWRRVGGGRRVGKQVAPKPQPWAVAVKYCGCFKNRSFLPRLPLYVARQSSVGTRSPSTLCRKICLAIPRNGKPARREAREKLCTPAPKANDVSRETVALSVARERQQNDALSYAHRRRNEPFREKIG